MKHDQNYTIKLFELLNEVVEILPEDDVKNIIEFIENKEWGLAYETFCIQLYEYNIEISDSFYEKITSLGKSMGSSSSIWLPLKELLTDINDEHLKSQ